MATLLIDSNRQAQSHLSKVWKDKIPFVFHSNKYSSCSFNCFNWFRNQILSVSWLYLLELLVTGSCWRLKSLNWKYVLQNT